LTGCRSPDPWRANIDVAVLGALALELDRQRRDLQVEVVDELEAAGGIKGAALWSASAPLPVAGRKRWWLSASASAA
jgi:hypothetical protein